MFMGGRFWQTGVRHCPLGSTEFHLS
uniref:Uncharacterized protein n=1 Tax=Anguilla anguilla TaxID=7936 RepID=A0A0E9UNP6_ANGAN